MRNPLVVDAKKQLFLAAFSRHGSLVRAERETGINRQRHYHWYLIKNHPQVVKVVRVVSQRVIFGGVFDG